MLDSLPLAWQAVCGPLLGAAAILITARVLPQWARRLVAVAAAVASLVVLWAPSLDAAQQGVEVMRRAEIPWQPLHLFRMSPALEPDSVSLLVGTALAWVTAALLLGIRGDAASRTAWQASMLVALAGCLSMVMAANVLTLAMGSALIDMALVVMILSAGDGLDRRLWRMLVPGVGSTLILVLGALQMDAVTGTASLQARSVPTATLLLLGIAALLRMLIFPFHPRGKAKPTTPRAEPTGTPGADPALRTTRTPGALPQSAAAFLPLAGIGIFLLARAQGIALGPQASLGPLAAQWPWLSLLAGVSLLAGGLVLWAGGLWPGIVIHQSGLALAFLILAETPMPWPLFSLLPAVGILAIWWDGRAGRSAGGSGWAERIAVRFRPWRNEARSYLARHFPFAERLRGTSLQQHARSLLVGLALASLAGLPLLAGSITRWHLYGIVLRSQNAPMLVTLLAADTLLVAGLWSALIDTFRLPAHQTRVPLEKPQEDISRRSGHPPHTPVEGAPSQARVGESWSRLLAMAALALALFVVGAAPGRLGLRPEVPGVSGWGLGLVFVLPWLLGTWWARASLRLGDRFRVVHNLAGLDWFFGAANWSARQVAGGLYWLGRVGEGEGWWGWALIILVVGSMLFLLR
jgi:hypothetical protein